MPTDRRLPLHQDEFDDSSFVLKTHKSTSYNIDDIAMLFENDAHNDVTTIPSMIKNCMNAKVYC